MRAVFNAKHYTGYVAFYLPSHAQANLNIATEVDKTRCTGVRIWTALNLSHTGLAKTTSRDSSPSYTKPGPFHDGPVSKCVCRMNDCRVTSKANVLPGLAQSCGQRSFMVTILSTQTTFRGRRSTSGFSMPRSRGGMTTCCTVPERPAARARIDVVVVVVGLALWGLG